jgi:IPT/TIG domain/FG-GAP repeat
MMRSGFAAAAVALALLLCAADTGAAGGVAQFVLTGPKLTPPDETPGSLIGSLPASQFGASVGMSADGSTAIVGGPDDSAVTNGGGAAWIYGSPGAGRIEEAKLTAADTATGGGFGASVALAADGRTALVEALGGPKLVPGTGLSIVPPAVYVFAGLGTSWTQQAELMPFGSGASARIPAGLAVSGDGNTLVVGGLPPSTSSLTQAAPGSGQHAGAAWIYMRSGTTWTQAGSPLTGPGDGDEFGTSVALSADGTVAVVGAPGRDAVLVFRRSGATWVKQGQLPVPPPAAGTGFGGAVALSADGTQALVGGARGQLGGAVWAFALAGGTWKQQGGELTGMIGGAPVPGFGADLALSADGDTALVGTVGPDSGTAGAGLVWAYRRAASGWVQLGQTLAVPGEAAGTFGSSAVLSSDGELALVGEPVINQSGGRAGGVWIYHEQVGAPPPRPEVTGFHPARGNPGTKVTITGRNLATAYEVRFNGAIPADSVTASATSVTVTVPPAAKTGKITVRTKLGAVRTAAPFTVMRGSG